MHRLTKGEMSGDKRKFDNKKKVPMGKTLLRLWRYIGKYRIMVVLAVILALTSSLLAIVGPRLSGMAINVIELGAGNFDMHTIYKYVMWMLICYLSASILSYILQVVMLKLSRSVAKQMRHDVFENLTRLPVSFFDKYQPGDIISTLTYDVDTVNQSLSTDLLHILQSSVTVIAALWMMLTIAPKLVLILFVTIPITILLTRYITQKVRPLFRKRSAKLGALNGFVEEMLSGQKTIHAYGQEQAVLARFDEKNNEAIYAYTKAEADGTITGPSVNFINNVSLALVSTFGSIMFLNGGVRLGDLNSFIQYSRRFTGPINETANIISELQSAFAAAERVFALIDAEPEVADAEDAVTLTQISGDVRLENVDFAYEEGKPIIQGLNLHAQPGSLTAIVGPTGAGKTTIINLLMRFYDIQGGAIYVDGHEIKSITRDSLRKAYSMVLQDTWLFHGTIFDNIAYGKPDATMEDVVAAAKAAHIHGYISRLPEGYNTILTDNGTSISKGQKQLLTIARAMLLDAHMLILDEATSNVDTRTEHRIQAAMRTLMKGKTCFVIAHRLSTIQSADNILVLDGGQVVEQGTHESLMAQKGFYYRLYQSQFDAVS
ncbi:MAG: ABC transporter ATP-binding protein [Oscillospiraceae bacterium]|nr:ABC transporter ATP-binding protein [Oscillospiraceae bacterium]